MAEAQDKGWCILELMGHRKLAGYITDDAGLLRIDVYLEDPDVEPDGVRRDVTGTKVAPIATQWYGSGAIYCITATTRENCLALTVSHQPAPIGRWELPAPEHEHEIPDAQLAAHDDPDEDWRE
jgi:hypothetical protein